MKLKDYLDKEGLIYGAFAKKIGVAYQTLYHIFQGKSVRLNTAMKIEIATRGQVTCADLLPQTTNANPPTENKEQLTLFPSLEKDSKEEKKHKHEHHDTDGSTYISA